MLYCVSLCLCVASGIPSPFIPEEGGNARDIPNRWLCVFFRSQHRIVVRRRLKDRPAGNWVVPLMEEVDSAAYVWPVKEFRLPGDGDFFSSR